MDIKLELPSDSKQDTVTVSVHLASENPFLFKLKLDEKLSTIRKELASKISKMDKKLLFSDKSSFIESENEDDFKLRDIVKKEGSEKTYQLYLSHMQDDVTVWIYSTLEEPFSRKLKLDDSLSTIRKELKMEEKLLFLDKGICFIKPENEDGFKLKDIIKNEGSEKTYQIYLKVKVWEYLNEKYKLDYGCNNEILRANKRAFTMTDCNFSIFPRPNYHAVKNDKKDHQMTEKSLSVNLDPGVIGSFGISGNKGNGTDTNSSDEIIYYSKSCLEFKDYLKPTDKFIKKVENINNSKTFKETIKEFGQFIPTKIIMGGKIHKKEDGTSKNKSKGCSADVGIDINVVKVGVGASLSNLKESSSQHGEESYDGIGKSDDEQSRNESLNDEKKLVIGQRILYSDVETCDYTLNGCGPYIGEFKKIPADILNRADFYVFAVILDAKGKKNDFFNCQIYCRDGTPKYIIHCIRMDRQFFLMASDSKCKLQIKYMIVGKYTDFNSIKYDELNSDIRLEVIKKDYNNNNPTKCSKEELLGFKSNLFDNFIGIPVLKDLNHGNYIIGHHFYTDHGIVGVFTFSYSLDQKKYIDLPDFSLHILKISNLKKEQFDYNNYQIYNEIMNHPKYFSLHSKDVFGPIFFKYTINEIKLKVVACECKGCCGVCKNSLKISKEKINFVYFNLPDEKSS